MQHPAPLQRSRPSGFTLVELLAVIMIIAMLAGLLTPAVMQALNSARNAAIKAEIDMLHMALMNYQSEYGVLPPCIDTSFSGGLHQTGGQATKHLKRIFPRCANPTDQLNAVRTPPVQITPVNAIHAWLSGYTTNPASPLNPAPARVKLFDFDQSRIDASGGTFRYFPSGKRNSPYIYIDSNNYGTLLAPTPVPDGTNLYEPAVRPGSSEFFNKDTFQILSAGRDEVWGNDDDLSNFWPGTKRDYEDSLKN
jgi:prepilin-type N-terminal cleavage/methylation domain-containing protein